MSIERFSALDRKIKSTENELNRLSNSPDKDFLFDSLNYRLSELQAEKTKLTELESREKLTIIISGEGVGEGTVSVRVLASVLNGIQSLADSIANALGNEPTQHGKIPQDIVNRSELKFTKCYPGSFGVELEGTVEDCLFYTEEPLLTQTISKLFALLSTGDDSDKITDQIAELGTRTLNNYKQWLKFISEQNININCNWSSSFAGDYTWKVYSERLPTILNILNHIKEQTEEQLNVIGKITGLNIRKETFEIINEDGQVISGRSRYDMLIKNKLFMGQKASLTLIKTTVLNVTTGKEKVSWYLKDIKPIPAP